MQRREFITLLGGAATASLTCSRAVIAQQSSTKVFRIGFLGLPTADSLPKRPEAFRAGPQGRCNRHPWNAGRAKRATTSIPIVCAVVGDAIGSGVVSNLARPGGNVTGLTFFNPELAAKRLELLKEILPDLTDVGILLNSANPINEPILPQMKSIAQPLKLELHQFDARSPADFEAAFAAMGAQRVGALVVIEDAMLIANAPAVARPRIETAFAFMRLA
jgi:hypothetical protein